MTNEDDFIKEWKMFYDNDSTVVNDVSEKRMRMLLEGFKLGIKVETIIIHKKIVFETPIDFVKEKKGNAATKDDYIEEAKKICEKYSIPMTTLRRTLDKSREFKNVSARKEFVQTLRSKFYSPVTTMGSFLNLDHTTIVYYLHGKKRIAPKNKVA